MMIEENRDPRKMPWLRLGIVLGVVLVMIAVMVAIWTPPDRRGEPQAQTAADSLSTVDSCEIQQGSMEPGR